MARMQAVLLMLAIGICGTNAILRPQPQQAEGSFECDIRLTPEQLVEIPETKRRLSTRKAVSGTASLWPNAIVPFEISSSSQNDTDAILEAIDHWESYTCLVFEEYDPATHTSWIRFIKDIGCWSYVGSIGGPQNISIGFTCEMFGTIVHEIGHAIGFWHEQSRNDRDDYVTVHYENIVVGSEGNFQKYGSSGDDYDVPYDVGSIMHFGDKYFSKNGLNTITAVDPTQQSIMGQGDSLSELDIALARLMYCPPGLCNDICKYDGDGDCDDGGPGAIYRLCIYGTDCTDCGIRPDPKCKHTCASSDNDVCDDGGVGSQNSLCEYGSDCIDCGVRYDALCGTTCRYNADGDCDDGGSGSKYNLCTLGSDCMDCGVRSATIPGLKKRSVK